MSKFNVSDSYLRAKEKAESVKKHYAAKKRKASGAELDTDRAIAKAAAKQRAAR